MNYKSGIIVTMLCLLSAGLKVGPRILQTANPPPQTAASEPGNGTAAPNTEGNPKTPQAPLLFHLKVSAEGMETLPTGSTIELKGNQEKCKSLKQKQIIRSGEVTFQDLPICKVQLLIFITGFATKQVSIDLAGYSQPMRILVKTNGPPEVDKPVTQ